MTVPMGNLPHMTVGVVAVSRDCFPVALARRRLEHVMRACAARQLPVVACETVIQNEHDALLAVAELSRQDVNAVVVYLGNFGPEGPATIFARTMDVPFMLCGAAEESKEHLVNDRGDALCGMLNACLNAGLRRLTPYLPEMPIGQPDEVAAMIERFIGVARVVVGLQDLKVFSFGPRPQDFYACNAPIAPLYDLGIEVMENSELDLHLLFQDAASETRRIDEVAADMAAELGAGNRHPAKLKKLAQFEIALMRFFEDNLGARRYGVFANKCWPAFERAFGFVPCFVNSRMAARGIPVACEVDIYGAVSEYMAQLASVHPVTILDINNTVPPDVRPANLQGAQPADLFMGFHCGNTPSCCLCKGFGMKYQLIMNRLMEAPDAPPDITCGTLEGTLKPGPTTLFRLQATPDGDDVMSYVAQGHILEGDPASFGCIGIFGVPGFARFYRHVLLARQFPHHTAVAFAHVGRVLFDALRMLGLDEPGFPKPASERYEGENPFAR